MPAVIPAPVPGAVDSGCSGPPAAPALAAPAPAPEAEGSFIKAPLVGTFYAASSPTLLPLPLWATAVKEGADRVHPGGQVKMMSEVPAPADGIIAEVLVSDGELVGFDQPPSASSKERTMFKKRVLIANRGEIAVRVIRACQELGVETVAVYSTADADSPPRPVGYPARSAWDRPRRRRAISTSPPFSPAATESGCDAVHPGYGFLSENAEFADLCAKWPDLHRAQRRHHPADGQQVGGPGPLCRPTRFLWCPARTVPCPMPRLPWTWPGPSAIRSSSRPAPAAAVAAGNAPGGLRRTWSGSSTRLKVRPRSALATASSIWKSPSLNPRHIEFSDSG